MIEKVNHVLRTGLVLAVALAAGSRAVGSDDPPRTDDILRGPVVADEERRTLVATDMAGRFVRIDGRPEAAALPLLVLEPAVRASALRVLDARFELVRDHVIDHLDLLRESSDAVRDGDQVRAERLQFELFRKFQGADQRTPMVAPLAEVLPAAAAAELIRLVDQYWEGWLAAESAEHPGQSREAIEARLRFQLFRGELLEVYDAILRPLQRKLDRVYEIAEVTEAQRQAIRHAVIAQVKESRLRPTDEARLALARVILAELGTEQRERIFAAALGGW